MLQSKLLAGFPYLMAESWKNLKDTITFSSFSMCKNQNRSVLVCDLLSNKHNLPVICKKINHLRSALMIWSTLQLTSKQWFITQKITARVDLFLKLMTAHVYTINVGVKRKKKNKSDENKTELNKLQGKRSACTSLQLRFFDGTQ